MKTKNTKKIIKTRKITKKHNVRNTLGRFTKNFKRDRLGHFA